MRSLRLLALGIFVLSLILLSLSFGKEPTDLEAKLLEERQQYDVEAKFDYPDN